MKSTKGKLFILVAIIGAIGLITATGAFGSVTAQRTADVGVSGDDAALLGLEPASGPGGNYVTGSDEITIDLTTVNTNATTEVPNALNITNRGNQEVAIQINASGPNVQAIAFAVQSSELDGSTPSADLTWTDTGNAYRIDSSGTPIDLEPGESIQVGFYVDTSDGDASDGLGPGPSGVIGADTDIITRVEISANAGDTDSDTSDSSTGNLEAA